MLTERSTPHFSTMDEVKSVSNPVFNVHALLHIVPRKGRRNAPSYELERCGRENQTVSSHSPIDLTDSASENIKRRPADMLKSIPIKFIKFAEDVRPPYIGTYSKTPKTGSICSLGRAPFGRVRPDTNYEYDSEAEWEDLGEGEDLESEGEEEEEDDEEADMDEFLDDEDPSAFRRRTSSWRSGAHVQWNLLGRGGAPSEWQRSTRSQSLSNRHPLR